MGCQLADELASGFGLHASASEQCVDVLAEGFAFRIFLASERCVVCHTFSVHLGQALPGLTTSMNLKHFVFLRSFLSYEDLTADPFTSQLFPF